MRFLVFISIIILFVTSAHCQDNSVRKDLKVFLNCQYCYQDYLRTQITWVDFVQDQFVSDVDMMVATLNTGSGGADYTLYFTGKREFSGMTDTLHFTTNAINTEGEVRDMMAQRVRLGLVRYAARTELQNVLAVHSNSSIDNEDMGIGSNPSEDPWNAWVFSINGNANVTAQKIFQNGDFSSSLNVSQVKESHKLNLYISGSYSEQRFDFNGEKTSYILRSQSASGLFVHSMNAHWSAGVFGYCTKSDFSNYDYYQNTSAAIEYNVFPYKEAQTKLITFSYKVGADYYDFQDTTIFNATSQLVPTHSVNATTQFTQAWGSSSCGLSYSSFLNDREKYSYGAWLNLNIRIFKGLSLSSYASFNVVRDQINIRKNGASDEEVLLQQQELLTDFNMYTYLGLSYRFGSIYNNVVNPRFEGG